ncbi:MAG: ATP-binding cassette domain-containing protein [Arcanobacterium sp.]|nr:ATP-binding cassette domain-containing protein [Arcanobacterium sp.]MDY6143088.1 ATP-binding cassette domain-containing protein [Arcanobacterium sp.]
MRNRAELRRSPIKLDVDSAHVPETPSIVVDRVSVEYSSSSVSPAERKRASLVQKGVARVLGRPPRVKVPALKNVSFAAGTGEFIGLLGANGAGKSTLMRIMAGIDVPSEGKVYAEAKPVLLGVANALISQLSGIENAKLGLLALGYQPYQMKDALADIVEFAELGEAIYRPIKTYSSGMAARLQFGISTAIRPQVLLIDEALSTGDASFREKSVRRMNEMLDNAGTVFLVSHSPQMIEQLCTRAIWLHEGQIVLDGSVAEVSRKYQHWARDVSSGHSGTH